MGALDPQGCSAGCSCQGGSETRCGTGLPDSPDCAINYHFGMLLGVDDFRAEQGFHVGRLRRHQRALHGYGVVYGYAVSFDATHAELKVGAGFAVDAHGRDLALDATQCVGLPAWWQKHRDDDEFADVANKDDVTFDADVVLCYSTCLSRPVPAIADACSSSTSDIAYSRVCESVQLKLVPRRKDGARPALAPVDNYHLLRVLLGLEAASSASDDQWLLAQQAAIAAKPFAEQQAAMDALWQAVIARAAAASPGPIDAENDATHALTDDCLILAHLSKIHVFKDKSDPKKDVWKASIDAISIDDRPTLLPTHVLQNAIEPVIPTPAPKPAGPLLVSASRVGTAVTLVFDKTLAEASIKPAALPIYQFKTDTGWEPLSYSTPVYDNATCTVTLTLDTAPSGVLTRITVIGTGSTPVLGADFIPAGAASSTSDGADLSTTISGE